eukprot:7385343-Prymnesium_polylepis.1
MALIRSEHRQPIRVDARHIDAQLVRHGAKALLLDASPVLPDARGGRRFKLRDALVYCVRVQVQEQAPELVDLVVELGSVGRIESRFNGVHMCLAVEHREEPPHDCDVATSTSEDVGRIEDALVYSHHSCRRSTCDGIFRGSCGSGRASRQSGGVLSLRLPLTKRAWPEPTTLKLRQRLLQRTAQPMDTTGARSGLKLLGKPGQLDAARHSSTANEAVRRDHLAMGQCALIAVDLHSS